eukprot:jgi/Chlat1/8349/Chrsp80S07783
MSTVHQWNAGERLGPCACSNNGVEGRAGRRRRLMAAAEAAAAAVTVLPPAQFIEDVEKWLDGREADIAIQQLNNNYQQYKLAESKLLQQRVALQSKLIDINKALDVVKLLQAKEGTGEKVEADFEVAEHVYAKVDISEARTVSLWLGANVMLEYSLEEAFELLQKNSTTAASSLEAMQADLQRLRDSITITEVSVARVHNHDVKTRRLARQRGETT